jgi:hypothetical protein
MSQIAFLPENNKKRIEAELFAAASIMLTYGLTDPFPVHDDAWMEDLVEIIRQYYEVATPS